MTYNLGQYSYQNDYWFELRIWIQIKMGLVLGHKCEIFVEIGKNWDWKFVIFSSLLLSSEKKNNFFEHYNDKMYKSLF